MLSTSSLLLAASTLLGLATAAPTLETRQLYTPGTLNNTQEFYVTMVVTAGLTKYNGYKLETYHTGAGLADPVFGPNTTNAACAYLNGTHLQFDVNAYPFSASGFPSDTNYGRWEPVSIAAGYGTGTWALDAGGEGIVVTEEEFGGWLVCEWYHGVDAPQLFEWIDGFAGDKGVFPSSCARVKLVPEYI